MNINTLSEQVKKELNFIKYNIREYHLKGDLKVSLNSPK